MRHEIPVMLKTGGGAIVNTSSVPGTIAWVRSAFTPGPRCGRGLTKLSRWSSPNKISVLNVAPAGVRNDMVDRFAGKEGEMRDLSHVSSSGRAHWQPSEEIAAAVSLSLFRRREIYHRYFLVVDGECWPNKGTHIEIETS